MAVAQSPLNPQVASTLNCVFIAGRSPNGTMPTTEPWKGRIVDLLAEPDAKHQAAMLSTFLQQDGIDETAAMGQIKAADPNGPPPPRYKLHTAAEAFLPSAPVESVIEDLLARKSVAVFFGPPGSLKTWLLIYLVICVSLGLDWLGFSTVQGPVLVIDEESGLDRFNRRLLQLLTGLGITTALPIYYICLAQFDLRDPADLAEIKDICDQVKPVLIVGDALVDLMVGGDENAVKDTQPLFRNLRNLADEKNAAVALIHHAGKTGKYRGSSAISGAVDLLVSVEAEDPNPSSPETRIVNLATEKSRDGEPKKFSAEVTFGILKVTVAEKAGQPKSKQTHYSKAEQYVIDYLTENGPSLMSDIKANANCCSENSARQAVYSLASKKVIRRCDAGGPGSAATFEMIPIGPLDAIMDIPF